MEEIFQIVKELSKYATWQQWYLSNNKGEKKMVLYIFKKNIALEALPCFEVPRHEGGSPNDGIFLLKNFKFLNQKNWKWSDFGGFQSLEATQPKKKQKFTKVLY